MVHLNSARARWRYCHFLGWKDFHRHLLAIHMSIRKCLLWWFPKISSVWLSKDNALNFVFATDLKKTTKTLEVFTSGQRFGSQYLTNISELKLNVQLSETILTHFVNILSEINMSKHSKENCLNSSKNLFENNVIYLSFVWFKTKNHFPTSC